MREDTVSLSCHPFSQGKRRRRVLSPLFSLLPISPAPTIQVYGCEKRRERGRGTKGKRREYCRLDRMEPSAKTPGACSDNVILRRRRLHFPTTEGGREGRLLLSLSSQGCLRSL